METETKFKVGDKVWMELEIINIDGENYNGNYSIDAISVNGTEYAFTSDGREYMSKDDIILFTKEELLEKLQPKSEYPKWMMVSNLNIKYHKRKVLLKYKNKYIAIDNATCEEEIKDIIFVSCWDSAKDIEEPTEKELLLLRIEAAEKELNELKEKVKEV